MRTRRPDGPDAGSPQSVAGIEAARIDEAIRPDTYEHYLDHIKDIQAWRQRAGV